MKARPRLPNDLVGVGFTVVEVEVRVVRVFVLRVTVVRLDVLVEVVVVILVRVRRVCGEDKAKLNRVRNISRLWRRISRNERQVCDKDSAPKMNGY